MLACKISVQLSIKKDRNKMEKYAKVYHIKSYECDSNGVLRLRTLFNYFQDMADEHADKMGLGYHYCIERNIGWIGGAYHVQINQLPKWEDKVMLYTWPSDATPVTGIRDFQMVDKNGAILVNATSQWVLVDLGRMRPLAITKHVGEYELIKERALHSSFPAITPAQIYSNEIIVPVRTDDIDINNHVNNAVYPTLCLDGVSEEVKKQKSISEIQVNFKKPAVLSDKILIKSALEAHTSTHQLFDETGSTEFARVALKWK